MANWGADFWGAYSDVARAHAAKQLFEQQMAGRSAFGRALQDPNIFLPSGGGQAPQGLPQGGPAPNIQASAGPIFQGLQQRGLDPVHAAVLAGNWKQESEFNPAAWNPKEGAGGMDQWRGRRLDALKALAGKEGKDWRDPNVQMDYALQEGKTTEAGPWNRFIAAKDPASANAALKGFIRYGDNSQGTRLANAQAILSKFGNGQNPQQTAQGIAQQAASIGGQPAGQMSWQHIVQALVSRNPNIDPGVLSQAVELFQPLMSQQSQMDWREQQLQLRELSLQLAEQRANVQATQGQERLNQQAANEQGRNERATQHEAGVQGRFNASNDARLAGLKQRGEEFAQRMAAAKTKADRDFLARQMKANADQYHQRMTELIQRGSSMQGAPMSPDDQKKSMDEETQRYEAEKARIQGLIDQSNTQTDQGAPSGGKSQVPASNAATPSKTPPTASQAAPKAYTDPGEFSKDLAAGTIAPGATYQDPEKGLLKFQGGNVRDSKNWVPVKAQQSSMNAAPRKPFIDFQTPSAMGPRESLMQAFFGG